MEINHDIEIEKRSHPENFATTVEDDDEETTEFIMEKEDD